MKDKTFGFWKELGKSYENFPSIYEYINKEINSSYEKDKLIMYLRSGGIVCVTSGFNFPNVINSKSISGSLAIRTDGLWEWPENLVEYIANFDLCIPNDWYDYISLNKFKISDKTKMERTDVEW